MKPAAGCRFYLHRLLPALALLLVLAGTAAAAGPSAREAETQRKLAEIRQEIAALSALRQQLDGERDSASRAVREADQLVDQESRALRLIDDEVAGQLATLAQLQARRDSLEAGLATQRESLAALLRSAYALGQHQQLKLLLAQDRLDAMARVQGYQRYFQQHRITRIETLLEELDELAQVVRQLDQHRQQLDASRAQQQQRIADLESQREERRALVAGLEQRLSDTGERLRELGRDEAALAQLLERLQDIFADIPDELDAVQPFAQRRGKLDPPLPGRTLTAFGGKLPDGRTSQGWLIAAEAGAPVRAVAHGRVAFSDWLKGYGLIVIVDHGDGYMSLYAQNDSLHRDVGDWIKAGDTLASAGSSGGRQQAALYFELRRNGRPVDPRGWFARR